MLNIRELEDLRTKEELINYFKAMGKNITDEEIEELKKSYEQAEENGNTLTMQQLDDVVGGGAEFHLTFLTKEKKWKLDKVELTSDELWHIKLKLDIEQDYRDLGTADGKLVSYAVYSYEKALPDIIQFSYKANRLNGFQDINQFGDRSFLDHIFRISYESNSIPWHYQSFDYYKMAYDILNGVIKTCYPELAKDMKNKTIAMPSDFDRSKISQDFHNSFKISLDGSLSFTDTNEKQHRYIISSGENENQDNIPEPSALPIPEEKSEIPLYRNHEPYSTVSNNDQWYALATGALCVTGIVATGVITSALNKDDCSK